MERKSCKLAKLAANLKVIETIEFDFYLKEVWIDLIRRMTKNKNDKINKNIRQDLLGITKIIFTKYYSLPGIIGNRLFRVFDINNNNILEYNEFKTGMFTLFCGNYEKTLRFIFDFYDFDADGKISKEDIRTVLLYVSYTNQKDKNDIEKLQNEYKINNILSACFDKQTELLDYTSFSFIVENINSDIYFMIYLFLLEKKPFCYKSINIYNRNLNAIIENQNYTLTEKNIPLGNIKNYSHSNFNLKNKKNLSQSIPFNRSDINVTITNNYSKTLLNNNIISLTYSPFKKERKIFNNRNNKRRINFENTEVMKNFESKIFDQNLEKTIFEAKIPDDILEKIDTIQFYVEEDEQNEIEEFNYEEIKENLESEKNNYEGYIYKLNNGKMIKIWFQLYYKDLFYFKNKLDFKHKGMHNLSGLFLKEEPNKILDDTIYYSFSINFPSKKRIYFCDNKTEFKSWKKHLSLATNYSNILEIYKIGENIGKGSFSIVKLAINKITKTKVAVKIMDKKKMSSSLLDAARTEIEIMKICQFPYIIKFIEAYETIDNIFIFMEYCPGGTLFQFLKNRNFKISEKLAVNILYKICLAVDYFHSYGITHRDLKPENILMTSKDDDSDIRILDFGLGKIIGPNEKCSEPYGTIVYCAPEIILNKPYTKIVDSWSLGVLAYALLYGKLPFWHNERIILKQYIVKRQPFYKGHGLNNISDEAINFIFNLLIKDPNKRMSISKALHHKLFQKFKLNNIALLNTYEDEKNKNELKNLLKNIENY